jgi:hypothetical protein
MAALSSQTPGSTFPSLLTVNVPTSGISTGLSTTLSPVQDGLGNSSPLSLSQTGIGLNGLTWPTTSPTSGQVLTASSTGILTWTTISLPPITSVSGSFSINGTVYDTTVTSVNTGTATTVYSGTFTNGGTASFTCQVYDSTGVLQAEDVMLATDGTNVGFTSYGVVYTGIALGTFTASITGGVVSLIFTPNIASTKTVTVSSLAITVLA